MKTSKKLLSLLLVLAMVFALGCTAYASDAETADTAEPTEETGDTTTEAPAEGEEAPAEGEEAEEETPAEEEAPAEETPAETASKIVIIHTNDIHGAIDGYAKIAALKAEYEAEGAAVLLMDAGDFSQGTVEVSSSKGATAVELMNLAGYDVATLGNHEFDYGYANLVSVMETAEFDVLAANVLYNGRAEFFYIKPDTYYARMFIDTNNNGVWDTGDYAADRQAETTYYYPDKIECKAKWDLTLTWNPTSRSLNLQKPMTITKQKPEKEKTIKRRNLERAEKLGIPYPGM